MRHVIKKKFLYFVVVILTLLILLHPNHNARRNYEYIDREFILDSLHEETSPNFSSSAIVYCDYREVLFDETALSLTVNDGDLFEGHRIREGGEYTPVECKPKFSVALIVPYRENAEQLRSFLVYMHTFLRRQKIHYRIYVVEQVDSRPFNRAKLMNIGAVTAMRAGYPCLILHDVGLLPLKPANLYVCTTCPRHMSSSINSFRFVLPYLNLIGGAIAIASKQYKNINGMSNKYFGRTGENNDLYFRLEVHNLKLCRFQPQTSRYHMVMNPTHYRHVKTTPIKNKKSILEDGLNTLQYTEVASVLHPLFTHIMVDL